jgi:GNAT superfamily N-acetyltransferase
MRLERILEELPAGFDMLRAEACAEGYRRVDRLAEGWLTGTMRFNGKGEALIAAHLDEDLTGIGGLTIDPSQSGALRMRRFYVRTALRRNGIGRALAEYLLAGHARFVKRSPSMRVPEARRSAIVGFCLGGPQRPYAHSRVG